MVNLLRKIFIKNYQDISNPKIRQKHGFLASFVGIFTNLFLFIIKLLIGIFIFSMSIISDAINNLTDMASCIVNIVGFKLAGKPADKEHPFGHERIEYIAGLIISFIILIIAVLMAVTSVNKIINNEITDYTNTTTTMATFIILVLAILIKLWQGLFYRKIAAIIDSISLKANAIDSINDVISTSAVLIATIIEFIFFKNNISIQVDGFMGIAISIFIAIMGIKSVIETVNPLIGEMPDSEIVKSIIADILNYKGVLGVHDCMCHSYGPNKLFMTIHVEVDYHVDVLISHDLMDTIENEIGKKYNVILTVHMDPIVTDSYQLDVLKEYTRNILKDYDTNLTLHDFRMVEGESHTNILFDVVLPIESKIKKDDLLKYLKTKFKEKDEKYCLVIKFDSNYLN